MKLSQFKAGTTSSTSSSTTTFDAHFGDFDRRQQQLHKYRTSPYRHGPKLTLSFIKKRPNYLLTLWTIVLISLTFNYRTRSINNRSLTVFFEAQERLKEFPISNHSQVVTAVKIVQIPKQQEDSFRFEGFYYV